MRDGRRQCRQQEVVEAVAQVVVQDRAILAAHLVLGAVGVVHVVRRIGEDHVHRLAAEQPLVALGHGGVAAQQAVAAQQPDVARARDRRLGHLGHRIVIGLALGVRLVARHQLGQRVGIEAGERQIEVVVLQGREFDAQHRVVPAGVLGDAVVGDHQGPALRRAQMVEHDHRHHLQPELLRGGEPSVPGDDHAVAAGQDRIGEAELGNRRGDLRHLLV